MPTVRLFRSLPVYNATTPSSAGAAGAPTFGRPLSGAIVNPMFPADVASEIVGSVEWLMQVDEP